MTDFVAGYFKVTPLVIPTFNERRHIPDKFLIKCGEYLQCTECLTL